MSGTSLKLLGFSRVGGANKSVFLWAGFCEDNKCLLRLCYENRPPPNCWPWHITGGNKNSKVEAESRCQREKTSVPLGVITFWENLFQIMFQRTIRWRCLGNYCVCMWQGREYLMTHYSSKYSTCMYINFKNLHIIHKYILIKIQLCSVLTNK